MERIIGFDPITHGNDRILILGSMPSIKSLEDNMYYANPTNRFWKMLGSVYQLPVDTVEDKLKVLEFGRIALWDSCHSCIREGSMDSNIKDVIANNIPMLLKENPSIQKILFNGKTSFNTYMKYFKEIEIEKEICPSTSAANAKFRLEDLVRIYKEKGL